MTKKEYIIEEPFELTATPISWLEGISKEELSADDILLVVSQPNYQVQDTGYISKKATLKDIKNALAENLSADLMLEQISYLSTEMDALAEINGNLTAALTNGIAYANKDEQQLLADPYILSSIEFGCGNISSINGYKLKDALSAIIPANNYSVGKFNQIQCDKIVINGGTMTSAVVSAANEQFGTVRIKDGAFVINKNKQFVSKDGDGFLYIDISTLSSNVLNDIKKDILDYLKSELKKDFYQTKVLPTTPSTLETNTIYYIYDT